jgi:hypothetical protein
MDSISAPVRSAEICPGESGHLATNHPDAWGDEQRKRHAEPLCFAKARDEQSIGLPLHYLFAPILLSEVS